LALNARAAAAWALAPLLTTSRNLLRFQGCVTAGVALVKLVHINIINKVP
jgi:hypothetical protein